MLWFLVHHLGCCPFALLAATNSLEPALNSRLRRRSNGRLISSSTGEFRSGSPPVSNRRLPIALDSVVTAKNGAVPSVGPAGDDRCRRGKMLRRDIDSLVAAIPDLGRSRIYRSGGLQRAYRRLGPATSSKIGQRPSSISLLGRKPTMVEQSKPITAWGLIKFMLHEPLEPYRASTHGRVRYKLSPPSSRRYFVFTHGKSVTYFHLVNRLLLKASSFVITNSYSMSPKGRLCENFNS